MEQQSIECGIFSFNKNLYLCFKYLKFIDVIVMQLNIVQVTKELKEIKKEILSFLFITVWNPF